ncbi:alpha/beta fold hydrolase [Tenggerimyces flavus]|uniref:Alpha/beta hydrolase n=1 Tax=Tenggerimyces flavus TaxID=1708749 RepID=A0ABV7YPF4_9ACTN|nr:hypothetical protein [Tenggerimyces flavus]MBM7784947.1 pimeloyl-ACP methyl ester carboxylesterase [Tenggerimyces flavus]
MNVLLIHGGLWDDMDAPRFWHSPGVVAGLAARGFVVDAPDRLARASSWEAEVAHASSWLSRGPVAVVAGSNGCTLGVKLALTYPLLVSRLLLAWPATPLPAPSVPSGLLDGETLRGVRDAELASLRLPVGVLRAVPENPVHAWRTADALLDLVPVAVELPGCTEPPRPTFAADLPGFVLTVAEFVENR